jgi:hypothetical protein
MNLPQILHIALVNQEQVRDIPYHIKQCLPQADRTRQCFVACAVNNNQAPIAPFK